MVSAYCSKLIHAFGEGWNRFWMTPSHPLPLAVLRLLTGLMALWWVGSYSADLVRFFGPGGMLPPELIEQLGSANLARFSVLDFVESSSMLWVVQITSIGVLVLFTLGLFTRVTSVLSLVVILSYVHRAPVITGQLEPILVMVLFYLCFGPAGKCLSLDAWRCRTGSPDRMAVNEGLAQESTVATTVVIHLIQVQLSVIYLMMGIGKLAEPGDTWWIGDAVWWLLATPGGPLVDLTFLSPHPYMINAWSHAIVLFELSFAILIWNRLARPLLLVLAVPMWCSIALLTGLVSFALMMLIANLAFVPASFWWECFGSPIGHQSSRLKADQSQLSHD